MVTSCQIIFFTFGLFVDLISLRIGRSILTTPQGVESLTSFYVVNLSARQKKRHTHLVGPSKLIETPSSGLKLSVGILQEIQLPYCIDLQQIFFFCVLYQHFSLWWISQFLYMYHNDVFCFLKYFFCSYHISSLCCDELLNVLMWFFVIN